MPLLDATVSFVLTVSVLALVVSVMVVVYQGAVGARKKGLSAMLRHIQGQVDAHVAATAGLKGCAPYVKAFVASLREVTWHAGDVKAEALEEKTGDITWISQEEYEARLDGSDLIAHADAAGGALRARCLVIFQTASGAASERFARLSRRQNLVAGVVLALLVNVDGLHLFRSYLDSASNAAVVAAQQKELARDVGALADAVTKRTTAVAALSAQASVLAARTASVGDEYVTRTFDALRTRAEALPAPPDPRLAAEVKALTQTANRLQGAWAAVDPAALSVELQRYSTTVEEWKASEVADVAALKALAARIEGGVQEPRRFPAGWSGFPRCAVTRYDPRCQQGGGSVLDWLLGVLFTGLLAGLGGPFWFDVLKRLVDTRKQAA